MADVVEFVGHGFVHACTTDYDAEIMTAYWPTSSIVPALTPEQRNELAIARVSRPTMIACHNATSRVPACTSLAIVQSEGVGVRRVYLQYPSFEQWIALERGGFIEVWDDFGFVMDALH